MQNGSDSNRGEPAIVLDHVGKTYLGSKSAAVHDVTFSVAEGEFVCIIGASGCGKSTVLKLIAGLEEPSEGTIRKPKRVAMVFQNGALFPWLTVEENVAVVLEGEQMTAGKRAAAVAAQLKLLGLERFAKNYPRELSGGQRQRVGIARALAVSPMVLLLDEPFSALDEAITHELHEDLKRIWKETGVTIVMVSHLISEAISLSDRIILMDAGSIVEVFPIDIPQPRHEQGAPFMHELQRIRHVFFRKT